MMTKHFLIILLDCYFSSLDRYIFISMSQESKRRQIQLLLNGKRHSPKEISSMVGVSKGWMEEKMPNKKIDWPSQSPDINPIENLFAWVKQTLIKRGPKNITELKEELTDVWENINADFLKNFWDSMPRRCQLVIDNNGHAIKY